MKLLIALLATVAATVSSPAHAGPVTVGSLYRADGSSTIADSLNDRVWLGWEVTKGLTYAQTLTAIGVGGAFQGYTIARNTDAQLFVDALVGGPNSCTATGGGPICSSISREAGDLVGESFTFDPTFDFDRSYFLSDNGVGQEVGFIEVYSNLVGVNSHVSKRNEAFSFVAADAISDPTGYLLYRSAASVVPEPGSFALVALSLLAAGYARKATKRS